VLIFLIEKTYHPPGAAQRSTTHFAYVKKSYFLLS